MAVQVSEALQELRKVGNEENPRGFPPEDVSPKVKEKKEWLLKYAEAVHYQGDKGEASAHYIRNKADMQIDRSYANGRQDIEQYKTSLNIRKQKGKRQQSHKNLDFAILAIGKKFKQTLKGKIKKFRLFRQIEAIDDMAKLHAKKVKADYWEYIVNRSFLSKLKENYGIESDTPMEHGEPEPQSMDDININLALFPKQRYIMEISDMLDMVNEVNNRKQIEDELIDDLVEVGCMVAKVETTNDGFERVRRCIPENCVSNNHKFPDGRDIYYFGEYIEMTMAELKEQAQAEFTAQEYHDIAEKATGRRYNLEHTYYAPHHTYPYDTEKIFVLDLEIISSDLVTHLIKYDENGNLLKVIPKKPGFPSREDGTPRPIDEYIKLNPNSEVHKRRIQNVYKIKWIVGTPYCYNHGRVTDMERVLNQLEQVRTSFKIYNLFDSPFRVARPILDNIQINWLKFQHHVAMSRVGGVAIEQGAFENITLSSNGKKLSPKQALDMYFETGVLLWRRGNWKGGMGSQDKPILEMQNSMNEGAGFHYAKIFENIQLLRDLLGLNAVTDASTPHPEAGKAVSQMAIQGTNDFLEHMFEAKRSITEQIDKRIVYMIPNALNTSKHPGLIAAIGLSSHNFLAMNSEVGMHEYSLKYELGLGDQDKQRLQAYLEAQLKSNGGLFDADEIFEFEREDNIVRAIMKLRLAKRRKQAEQMQQQQAIDQANTERQLSSNQQAEAEKRNTVQLENELKKDYDSHQTNNKIMINRQQMINQSILEKLKHGHKLTEAEQAHIDKMIEIEETKEWDLKIKKAAELKKQNNIVSSKS